MVITVPSAIEQLAHDILAGAVTDTILYTQREWLPAAGDAVEGDPTDLENFDRETDLYRNGHWNDPEGRASESYVPISCERPCAALYGQYR